MISHISILFENSTHSYYIRMFQEEQDLHLSLLSNGIQEGQI